MTTTTLAALPPVDITLVEHVDAMSDATKDAYLYGGLAMIVLAIISMCIFVDRRRSHGLGRLSSAAAGTVMVIVMGALVAAGGYFTFTSMDEGDDHGVTLDDASVHALSSAQVSRVKTDYDGGFAVAGRAEDEVPRDRAGHPVGVSARDMLTGVGDSAQVHMERREDSVTTCTVTLVARDGDQDANEFKRERIHTTNIYRLQCP